jgi:chromosome segregation ATPase
MATVIMPPAQTADILAWAEFIKAVTNAPTLQASVKALQDAETAAKKAQADAVAAQASTQAMLHQLKAVQDAADQRQRQADETIGRRDSMLADIAKMEESLAVRAQALAAGQAFLDDLASQLDVRERRITEDRDRMLAEVKAAQDAVVQRELKAEERERTAELKIKEAQDRIDQLRGVLQ